LKKGRKGGLVNPARRNFQGDNRNNSRSGMKDEIVRVLLRDTNARVRERKSRGRALSTSWSGDAREEGDPESGG